jgi:hypothetical protein
MGGFHGGDDTQDRLPELRRVQFRYRSWNRMIDDLSHVRGSATTHGLAASAPIWARPAADDNRRVGLKKSQPSVVYDIDTTSVLRLRHQI